MNKNILIKNINLNITNDSKFWLKKIKKTKKVIKTVLLNNKYFINKKCKIYNITFLLTYNKKIKILNKKYNNKPKPTDVLTFINYQKINGKIIKFADIAISGNMIKSDANKLKIDFYDHFTHIVIHALLHSNNYTHDTNKKFNEMRKIEVNILKLMNIENPYI